MSEADVGGTSGVVEHSLRRLSTKLPIALIGLMILARFVPSLWQDGPTMTWAIGALGPPLAAVVLLLVWWLGLSRASWQERVFGFVGVIACIAIVSFALHETMRELVAVVTLPIAIAGFGLGMVATSSWLSRRRTLIGLAACLVAGGSTTLVRNEGAWGSFAFDLHSRFSPTPEEIFLAERESRGASQLVPIVDGEIQALIAQPDWAGFRGDARNGVQYGTVIEPNWKMTPPVEVWRIKVGPAWSSFAAAGNLLFTQEQRGELEAIVCYSAQTGQEKWVQSTEARFFEALGGLGPRATPTIHQGAVYSQGADGDLLKLDGATGEIQWQVNLCEVANRVPPMWGFSCSPLVADGLVVVHAGGKGELGILAFDAETGQKVWSAAAGEMSYGSLQVVDLAGRRLLGLLTDVGAELFDPVTGKSVHIHSWPHTGYRSLQPLVLPEDQMLIPTGMGTGTRLVQFVDNSGQIESSEVWTSRRLKPDFNDVVVHKGYVYGFDNSVFACIRLSDGELQWKGGRYGKGQALLLADADQILLIGEEGQLVLLATNPESHSELATMQVLEGRTWNHPVVIGDRLFIRNASEAACYKLPISP